MKKHVLLVAAAFGLTFATNAQDDKNYLPESGDWGLGFDASPLINYAGNLFNGTTNNSMNAMWENGDNAIMGKYFLDESTAVRGWLRLGFGSTTDRQLVTEDGATDPNDMVEDSWKMSYSAITIGGGLEMRKGGPRLQGYYGGALYISTGSTSNDFTYGNDMDETTGGATTADFAGGSSFTSSRTISSSSGSMFGLGLGGFIGVEYFILPKISISAEYFWGLMMSSVGDGTTTSEYIDFTGPSVEELETTTAGESSFAIDTDNNGGAIRLMFHF